MWKHKDVHNLGGAYVYIHPYKQQTVAHLVENLPDWADYCIVFGSAVMPFCRPDSDVDICIIGDYPEDFSSPGEMRLAEESYDFLYYKTPQELRRKAGKKTWTVERNIYEKGVVVYAK